MAVFMADDDKPIRKAAHELGQDLYTLSLEELEERIDLLKAEIERLDEARRQKSAQRAAADSVFGAPPRA